MTSNSPVRWPTLTIKASAASFIVRSIRSANSVESPAPASEVAAAGNLSLAGVPAFRRTHVLLLGRTPVMAAGLTMRSKSAALMYPEARAAARRVVPWSLAWWAMAEALS
jgi:hypothetical protein